MSQLAKALPIHIGDNPKQSKGVRIVFPFSQGSNQYINYNFADLALEFAQSCFVDNSNNSAQANFTIPGTGQMISVPPYAQAVFPIYSLGFNLQIQGQSSGAVDVGVVFMNCSQDLMIWYVTAPGAVTGAVTVQGSLTVIPQTGAFTDRSGAITSAGVSQTLAVANGTRKRLVIQNPASLTGQNIAALESLYVNFTNAAGVDNGSSFELLPGEKFDLSQMGLTTELVSVTAATAGHRYIAKEM
jgi:hypothetical protein